MKTDYLQSNDIVITVAGHLQEKRGIYQMALSWKDCDGNRKRKSVSTGLPVKGNKKRAEAMLQKTRQEHEEMLNLAQQKSDGKLGSQGKIKVRAIRLGVDFSFSQRFTVVRVDEIAWANSSCVKPSCVRIVFISSEPFIVITP